MADPVIIRIESILGKPITDLTDIEVQGLIESLRFTRASKGLRTLKGTGIKPVPKVKPRKRAHKHRCSNCPTDWPCPHQSGCIEPKTFGLCPGCNNNEPYPTDKIRVITTDPDNPPDPNISLTTPAGPDNI